MARVTFLFPAAWAWLASVLGVVALYLLRRRERERTVSALFLWERIPPDRTSRLQRLLVQADLLLLLQVLAVALFAFALAHPAVRLVRSSGSVAIVLDGSASMGGAGRAEEAVGEVGEIISGSSGPWTVVVWADPPWVLVPTTDRREVALALLGGYRPTLGSRPPLGRALALLPPGLSRTVVVTDDLPAEPGVEVVALPPRDNLAIVAFAARSLPGGGGYEAVVRVRNDTSRYQDVQVALDTGRGTYLGSRLLGPGEEDLFTFQMQVLGPALRAELFPRDGFPWDNVRYYALEGAAVVRVRWLGEEDRYLWAALRAALPAERVSDPPWDLTVAVRTELPALPGGPALLVGSSSPEAPLGEAVGAAPFRAGDGLLLRHVVPENLRADAVLRPELPSQAVVELWAGDVPALARWEGPRGRRVLVTVDLARSNFPLAVDFPILLRNVTDWLLPFRPRTALAVGEAMELPPGAEVVTPAGPVSGVWIPDRPGLYEVRGERTEVVAVNVPYEESFPGWGVGAGLGMDAHRTLVQVPVWPWVGGAALLLLLGEWVLAWRRGVG